MTVNEAIYCLKADSEMYSEVCEECPLYKKTGSDHCWEEAINVAIQTLEQILEPDHKVMTNADRIRDMTDEELAELFSRWVKQAYKENWLNWLQSPVDNI